MDKNEKLLVVLCRAKFRGANLPVFQEIAVDSLTFLLALNFWMYGIVLQQGHAQKNMNIT
jgi:hypothetical protein